MLSYYFQLGTRSLKRNPVLTALMVLGIALGIGASMTSRTVFHLMSSDPIPWKSDKLFSPQLDSWDPNQAYSEPNEPPDQVTYRDAMALIEAGKADRQVAMYRVAMPVQPENPEVKPYLAVGRATYADFFPMFEPPFQYGGGWDRGQDSQHGRVVVLSRETNEKLFGGQDSVGKRVKLKDDEYTIVGVLNAWRPTVKYFDLNNGTFEDMEEFYIPFTTSIELQSTGAGNNNCWGTADSGWEGYLRSECVWIQFWVQLDSKAKADEYRAFLDSYAAEQKKLGRFPRPLNNKLRDVNEWMTAQKVVSSDVEVQVGLAFAFLAVCLINTVGLLLAKFMRKSPEIGLRRALGASKSTLFLQHIIESGAVGLSGGVIGLVITFGGLMVVRVLYKDYGTVAHLDWTMTFTAIALAIASSMLAGLYPTWRACQIAPAAQLKTQ